MPALKLDLIVVADHIFSHFLGALQNPGITDEKPSWKFRQVLRMAIKDRKTRNPMVHHSDRGLHYCSEEYQSILKKNEIQPSMTDGYDSYQNALAERINGILKGGF